ncbi:MAG: ABC-F family ATP-binding cassette domain-containing protein [Phycisphaerae bacterium]|nr:ABC-F family ATP-binding cassette domain-containing protein [Phycisphaerae bacterium]
MSIVVGEGICKSWSERDVLRGACFSVGPEDRIGLVGPNGHGKTTLLRIIAGADSATEGTLEKKKGLRIGYLPQDPPALEGSTLRAAMTEVFARLIELERQLHELHDQLETDGQNPSLLRRYGELQHEFEIRGGYGYAGRIDGVLEGLGFERHLWDQPLLVLSGGQRTRAYLGRLLLEDPELLLLDEPTNHLDLEAVQWLERWLAAYGGALIVVSHDRYFLDRVTQSTWEVAYAAVECYKGAYSDYLRQRDERFLERMRVWEAQQEFINETQEFIRRFLAGQRSKEAQGRRTRLERFMKTEAIERPREHDRIAVRLKALQRTGDFVLYLQGLRVGYESARPLVSMEKMDVQRGQRIAIVGANGCGKTTLLRTILGQLKPLAGACRYGANVQLGYLSQTHAELRSDITALEAVRQMDPSMTEERGRGLLGSMLLSGDDAFKKIGELSGGQRSRVVLARLMLAKANVLILDEPTNHLDIASQEVLQDVLSDFDGTVVFVSHDRYLIQALATHIWAVEDGGVVSMSGNWEKYAAWRQSRLEEAGLAAETKDDPEAVRAKQARVDDYKDRKRRTNDVSRLTRKLAQAEAKVHELESRLDEINDRINTASASGNVTEIAKLGAEYATTQTQLGDAMTLWEKVGVELEEASQ